jgi:hypothetical protein
MKEPPSRSSPVLHGHPQEQKEQRKPSIKTYLRVLILWSLVIIPPFTTSLPD